MSARRSPHHIYQLPQNRACDAFVSVAPADVVLHRWRGMFEAEAAVFLNHVFLNLSPAQPFFRVKTHRCLDVYPFRGRGESPRRNLKRSLSSCLPLMKCLHLSWQGDVGVQSSL
ncbi:hypothetical protein [Persicirhabdus sediminis]|uniref:Uncharacterized protein n=1 Tax=Persicirhabdus sediminis TaxID=454144 RepID=A0A8J7SI33_9BACT|nr:hypothetical protein [Persicirhabdus sediminis]MBK1790259.1 hypothetical protein [Persicirhabdus sediminis]